MACLLLLEGCISPLPQEPEPTLQTFQPAEPPQIYESMEYQYKTDISASINFIITELDPEYLVLANKTHPLGREYEPAEVVELECPTYKNKSVELESRTAQALYAMLEEMKADGVTEIYVTSGYRDYNYQKQLYDKYCRVEENTISQDAYAYFGEEYIKATYLDQGKTELSLEDAELVVQSYSAKAGTSEHQSGLCVDFVTSSAMLTQSFENTDAFDWLSQNAYRFGYILRYPEDKTEITGFSYEPWHFRFVGREAATELYFRNLVLEELSGIF